VWYSYVIVVGVQLLAIDKECQQEFYACEHFERYRMTLVLQPLHIYTERLSSHKPEKLKHWSVVITSSEALDDRRHRGHPPRSDVYEVHRMHHALLIACLLVICLLSVLSMLCMRDAELQTMLYQTRKIAPTFQRSKESLLGNRGWRRGKQ